MATKAELKKEATKRKREFYAKLLGVVTESVVENTVDLKSKFEVRIKFTGSNRYINFSVYGFKMSVIFYTQGQIVIQLDEFCHGKFEQQIYEYTDSVEEQEACLERLKRIMDFMIPFFNGDAIVDAHTFMDYVKNDVEIAYQQVLEDWKRYEE